jgi:hypothetical protein
MKGLTNVHDVKRIARNVARMRDRFCEVPRFARDDTHFRFAGKIGYAA